MAIKRNRSMKVYGQSGYRYQTMPTIMLKGKWPRSWASGWEIISPSAARTASSSSRRIQREDIMAEVAKVKGKPLKGDHGDHHFKNRDEVGKEYGLSGSSMTSSSRCGIRWIMAR